VATLRADADVEDDLFDMADLSPAATGLPMVVRISERGRARHDARVEVSTVHGRRAHPDRTVSVSLRPTVGVVAVGVVAGQELPADDLERVRQWIELNREALLAYWDGALLTDEVMQRLVRLDWFFRIS